MHNDPRNQNSVFRSLSKIYGKEFMLIGFLKFVADSSGFLSPILLNWVVLFMEDKSMDIRWGYVYALGLCGSTLVAALCNTHFNLLISELKLKVSIILSRHFRQPTRFTKILAEMRICFYGSPTPL